MPLPEKTVDLLAPKRSHSRANMGASIGVSASSQVEPLPKSLAARSLPSPMCMQIPLVSYAILMAVCLLASVVDAYDDHRAMSGVRAWVDRATPQEKFDYTSSRGDKWNLIMSDEFGTPGRSFLPGSDHLWTAIDAPDGTRNGLGYYAKELATTECQDSANCYLKLEAIAKPRSITVWNPDASPPKMENVTVNYQSAMLQSWNKFCFQGGMVEVRAKLPGTVTAASKNPDVATGTSARVKTSAFYPTWPGVWLMGNLGRALFRDSTDRMWPFSYDKCDANDQVSQAKTQRISACDANPGSGLNANQGRGAPQIDLFQGGGLQIASSLHVAPGMPSAFRRIEGETPTCAFNSNCTTPGANTVGVPKTQYDSRNHKSWYQGLRYAFNHLCARDDKQIRQSFEAIQASLASGIYANTCDLDRCPASFDINSDLQLIGSSSADGARWGINTDGACFAQLNPYDGSVQCDRLSRDAKCAKPTLTARAPAESASRDAFQYRADSLSAKWPAHVAMFTDYMVYQVEWVPGADGYIRWMLDGHPVFEIAAETLTKPPQDNGKTNPTKILPEEPMYLILNVAMASTTTAEPPVASRACQTTQARPNASKSNVTTCDQFPMALQIDYVRVYQDMSSSSSMSVGCDPASHPTKQWIQDHIDEYADTANPVIDVVGKAFCSVDEDCTVAGQVVGTCTQGRCVCSDADWSGPRCTISASASSARTPRSATPKPATQSSNERSGPEITLGVAAGIVLAALFLIIAVGRQVQRCVLYRKMTPSNHNVRPTDVEPFSDRATLSYQLSPINEASYQRKSDFLVFDTPSSEDRWSQPNFVVQLY